MLVHLFDARPGLSAAARLSQRLAEPNQAKIGNAGRRPSRAARADRRDYWVELAMSDPMHNIESGQGKGNSEEWQGRKSTGGRAREGRCLKPVSRGVLQQLLTN